MTLKQAKKHIAFRPSDDRAGEFEMCGPYGWLPCSPEQSAWLAERPEEHLPLKDFYWRARQYSHAMGCEAFGMFIVEGVRK